MSKPRYIDANKIEIRAAYGYNDNGILLIPFGAVKHSIARTPTEDVVQVVRCKDCKHKNPNCDKCLRDNLWHDADDFCSYGEKAEGEDDETD